MKNKLMGIFILSVCLFTRCNALPGGSHFDNSSRHFDSDVNSETNSKNEIKKEFRVASGGNLKLDMNSGGAIEIKGWDKDIVLVEISQKNNDVEFEFKQDGNGVSINSEYVGERNSHKRSPRIIVTTPFKYNSWFKTMGGEVKVSEIEGKIEGTTMGGAMNFSKIKGTLYVETMGGEIKIRDSEVNGRAKTMGGPVLVENVIGDIDASSMGGRVQHINVKGTKKSIGKEVDIHTMGGDLDVDEAPNGAKLKTMGGDIKINSVSKFLEAETMGGDIRVRKAEGQVKVKTMGGDVDVTMISDQDGNISLVSMGGDITLVVPNGSSWDVDIEIAYTRNKHGNYNVISDFTLNEERTKEWESSHGSERKYIYDTGMINGGKNKIKIKTVNGNVYLKKS